jgi:hypothetical protein
MHATASLHPGARHRWADGAAGGEAQEAAPCIAQLVTFSAVGGTPESDGTVGAWHEPPEALVEWWHRVSAEEAAQEDAPPTDLDALAWTADDPGTGPERWGKGGPGGGSPPAVSPSTWETWVNDWLRSQDDGGLESWDGTITVFVGFPELDDGGVDGADEGDASVHWIPYEYQKTAIPGASTDVHAGCEKAPSQRRAGAEVDGWRAVDGHQRHNPGWAVRHHRNAKLGGGLEVEGATRDERRIAHRIRHCGEGGQLPCPPDQQQPDSYSEKAWAGEDSNLRPQGYEPPPASPGTSG